MQVYDLDFVPTNVGTLTLAQPMLVLELHNYVKKLRWVDTLDAIGMIVKLTCFIENLLSLCIWELTIIMQ